MKITDNYPKIALLIGAVVLLSVFGLVGIPLTILYYILVSVVFQNHLK